MNLPSFEAAIKGRVLLQLLQDVGVSQERWEPYNTSSGQKQPGEAPTNLAVLSLATNDRQEPGSDLSFEVNIHTCGELAAGVHSLQPASCVCAY